MYKYYQYSYRKKYFQIGNEVLSYIFRLQYLKSFNKNFKFSTNSQASEIVILATETIISSVNYEFYMWLLGKI